MHRFFLKDTNIEMDTPVDLTPLARQLRRVLRLQPGAQIEVLNGDGQAYAVELTEASSRATKGIVLSVREITSEPTIDLTLYQCSLKADKFEWVLQKGTELGVNRFVPVISRRSVVRKAAALRKKYDRWRAIIREAAEQSGRGRLPTLADPVDFAGVHTCDDALCLLPYEAAIESTSSLGQTVEDSGIGAGRLPANEDTRSNFGMQPSPHISLMIGPEGGFDATEVEAAHAAGWRVVSLGRRVLRAETAALAAITVVMERAGAMR